MQEFRKIADVLKKLNFVLTSKQKKYFIIIFLMGCFAALLELLGVAAILPVLDIIIDIEQAREKWYIAPFINVFGLTTNMQISWLICGLLISIYIFKNIYFIFYTWVSLKFSCKVQRELASRILKAYMKQGYIFFVGNNTSELLQGIGGDVSGVYYMINTLFTVFTKSMSMLCIAFFIIAKSKDIAVVLLFLIVLCFAFIQIVYRKSLRQNGIAKRECSTKCSQASLEAIQGYKEILTMHKQDYFVSRYRDAMAKLNKVTVKIDLAAASPAYIIEMICICGLLLAIAIQMGRTDNFTGMIEQLSTIAVGAFRILPALGGVASGINMITMNTPLLTAAYKTLVDVKKVEKKYEEKKLASGNKQVEFKNEIRLENISFKYPNAREYVVKNINLTIKKGESIAFIGPSGAGKTTISDIILSLLKPDEGKITMDGIDIEELEAEWSRLVGYVPQSIYMVDDTIRNNIAFGEDEKYIDESRIWKSLEIAQLKEFVEGLPAGIDTLVGEQGVRFSGGQKQRLAIARVMYRDPEILILDEATAALDNETETEVMRAIDQLQGYKTLIIVAHRLSTIRKCDTIYEVKNMEVRKKDKKDVL